MLACPRCGDLSHPESQTCETCGYRLIVAAKKPAKKPARPAQEAAA